MRNNHSNSKERTIATHMNKNIVPKRRGCKGEGKQFTGGKKKARVSDDDDFDGNNSNGKCEDCKE